MPTQQARPKVITFTRNYLVPDVARSFGALDEIYDVTFLADGKSALASDTRADFYAAYKDALSSSIFSTNTLDDIIGRCRMLREIDYSEALRRVNAITIALEAQLDRLEPDVLISQMVDEYVTDVLYRLCVLRDIPYVCFCPSFFAGRVFVSRRPNGAHMDMSSLNGEEVSVFHDEIMDKAYRANYMQSSSFDFKAQIKGALRFLAKRLIFPVKGWLENDPLNVHYAITPYLGARRNIFNFPDNSHFSSDWRSDCQALAGTGIQKPLIYFPLGFVPEATNNYWIKSHRVIEYNQFVLDTLKGLSGRYVVAVKEHIHMVGIREQDLYRQLEKFDHVVMVPPSEFSKEVLQTCDAVVIGAGSTGVEATLFNKPVLSYCPDTYWFEAANATLIDLDNLEDLALLVEQSLQKFQPLSEPEKVEFMRVCLNSTLRSSGPGTTWPLISTPDVEALIETVLNTENEPRFT
jgi:hypothetical protein